MQQTRNNKVDAFFCNPYGYMYDDAQLDNNKVNLISYHTIFYSFIYPFYKFGSQANRKKVRYVALIC